MRLRLAQWVAVLSAGSIAVMGVAPALADDTDAPAAYLRWQAVDGSGAAVPGASFRVQGDALSGEATVTDDTGAAGYDGADLDPKPGVILVSALAGEDDTTEIAVASGDRFRVDATDAPAGYDAAGDDWNDLVATDADDETPVDVVLAAEAEAPDAEAEAPDAEEDAPEGEGSDAQPGKARVTPFEISPLIAQQPDGASAPYTYWNVVDENGDPVSGATFSFQAWVPIIGWGTERNVADCTSGNCSGFYDRDNDGGDYLVKWIGRTAPGANPGGTAVSSGSRYRLTPEQAPAGYVWLSSTDAVDSNSLSWSSNTLNFGTFVVRYVGNQPVCEAGYVYGIENSGQIRMVTPGGAVSNFGSPSGLNDANFNGLGIGTGGTPVYAYSRGGTGNSDSKVSIYRFNTTNGTWSDTGIDVDSNDSTHGGAVTFVAGAVNLDTDRYFLGGYLGSGSTRVFRLWEYAPSANSVTYRGAVKAPGDGTANGDIAFDADGNLFIVRGAGSTTTVYSVTAASLAAASGGMIPSSASQPVNGTTSDVNGVAFDADGKGYLSSSGSVEQYDMPGWTGKKTVTSALGSSTDLSSCGSPPTITIEKVIEGGRAADTDQFTLTLRRGGTTIATTTTTGDETGVQAERLGPLPTVRNVELTFTETAAGTTNLSDYVSSYRCSIDGVQQSEGNATTGTITIPSNGQAVKCQFFNAPLTAQVTVHKDVTDVDGENPEPRQGWTVGATATATTGSLTGVAGNPGATTTTNASGDASWKYRFGSKTGVATVAVHEQMQPEYDFQSGACVVTHLDGTTDETTLTGPATQNLTGIVPGDKVDCTYVNRLSETRLTLVKQLDHRFGGTSEVGDWTLTAAGGSGTTTGVSGATGAPAVTDRLVEPGTYSLAESGPAGYDADDWVCTNAGAGGDLEVSAQGAVTIPRGANATCTVTNLDRPGSLDWAKVDSDGERLTGSEWTLTGPGTGASSTELTISEDACDGPGTGDEPYCETTGGAFTVGNLSWGTYTLEETRAPAGYIRDTTERTVVIDGSHLSVELDDIVNAAIPSPELPLSGGLGRDAFLIGGLGILAAGIAATSVLVLRRRRKEVA